jgi:hypothetical protein
LFERCIEAGKLRTAGSYLLVLHNMEEGDDTEVSEMWLVLERVIRAIGSMCVKPGEKSLA